MIRCKTKIAKVFKGLGCLFTTLALWCFVCQFSLCIGIVMMQQNRQNSPSFCHCRPLGMSFQLPVWYPDNTQRLLSLQISSKCRVPLRNVTVAFFLEIVMRGYNSRHIVILMSVSLVIREFIKRCLCTHCYLVVWSGVPQGDVLCPITFQGEEADLGVMI